MTEDGRAPNLAVLIDADNTSAHYAQAIFEKIVKLGEANVRRIYGDFSGSRLAGWDAAIQSLAILQHQQRSNTRGKNAADIALVIDGMDFLHKAGSTGSAWSAPTATSPGLPSGYARTGWRSTASASARRPRPSAAPARASSTWRTSWRRSPETGDAGGGAASRKTQPLKKAVPIIAKAMEEGDEDGWVHLGTVGSRILGAAPDFDPRTYGRPNLSTLEE